LTSLVLSDLERLKPFGAGKVTELAMRTGLDLSVPFCRAIIIIDF